MRSPSGFANAFGKCRNKRARVNRLRLSLRATEGDELIRSAENGPEGIELRKPHRLCCQTVKHALGMGDPRSSGTSTRSAQCVR